MAQTKRKRQTKHRGNAAGVVEARGRTGRRPTAAEKSPEGREKARAKAARGNRLDKEPSWSGAFYRAMAAAVLMLLMSLLLGFKSSQVIALFPVVLLLYVPISYYSDMWLYRRRQRNKAKQGAKPAQRGGGGKVGPDGGAA
ncbi:MAG: hypothetical protein ACHQDY_00320 [Solirubrobacterales bacterium]